MNSNVQPCETSKSSGVSLSSTSAIVLLRAKEKTMLEKEMQSGGFCHSVSEFL